MFYLCKIFFIICVLKENARVKVALTVPAGTPIALAKIDTPPIVADKTIKAWSM